MISSRQLAFVWHRGRNLYVQILFLGARYAALACAILYWFLVRQAKLAWVVTGSSAVSKWGLIVQDR